MLIPKKELNGKIRTPVETPNRKKALKFKRNKT